MGEQAKGWRLIKVALTNRKTAVMLAFGFGSGLPYTLLIGTLNAWLGEAKVDLATIGILSWIGLAYAFKFLWSPLVDGFALPGIGRLGRRRSWLILAQLLLGASFGLLALTDPVSELGTFALIAVIAAFASATQDVVVDAWRIDVADETAPLDLLSTIYQLGYRIAALVGGALALVLAARIGWPLVYGVMGAMMIVAIGATLAAPDTPRPNGGKLDGELGRVGAIHPRLRAIALAIVALGWGWAIWTIGRFMTNALLHPGAEGTSAGDFTKAMGPWIVAATVILPAFVAAWLNVQAKRPEALLEVDAPARSWGRRLADHSYTALVLPLTDLVERLRFGAIIVLGLILSYRLCDSIWGPFAFPFYLEELGYSNDEVAFASKIFGVGMTIAGIALGGLLFVTIGRMPTLIIGAITAAASNLLYADLAAGAPVIDAVVRLLLLDQLGADLRMVRLLVAISGENIAGGLAGAAFVAYLSSIASRRYSAVQYALLSSLTFLIGSLGRGALGEAIKVEGYAPVFRFTAALGLIAVLFCILEWLRQSWAKRRAAATGAVPAPDVAHAAGGEA